MPRHERRGLRALLDAIDDFVLGLHSGIPLCCVLDFLHTTYVRRKEFTARQRWREFNMEGRWAKRSDISYVPCRLCLPLIYAGEKTPATVCKCARRERLLCRFYEWRFGRPFNPSR
jgi:hypothetical protein